MNEEKSGRFTSHFTPEEEEQLNKFSKHIDLYNYLTNSIAPAIYGHNGILILHSLFILKKKKDIKKAILCQLFGGSSKLLPDGMRIRGDINILLLGDPGTAKSQMLKFVEKVRI